ncbi:Uu.00g116790.m01.CDS01 [Anthostomella pinea]|uniref:Uu.00g116790.m01.CDS01 n=1 Tax=Anthostomella pinea TaxID=933095 RepID=A0AAI8VH20_9PEZI|nr:Uu.00g116790.m01.CDS01 [Anthostomella pinea]
MMMLLHLLLSTLSFALASKDPGFNCQPRQKCWPSPNEWQQLNITLGGHLYLTVPLGAPCYPSSIYYNEVTCSIIEKDITNDLDRVGYYGQTYWQSWEACGTSACSLAPQDQTYPLYSTCSLGRLGAYYIDVRSPSHVAAAMAFAKTHNIRLSIKNTGHDYFGRSAVPNSLALWTHNLNSLSFNDTFTLSGCPANTPTLQNIGTMGAGVIAKDAYVFFNGQHNMDITGGYEETVGLAGGFGQGGGVGDFTTLYGLMVDNAVEFEVVTADGKVRIINECVDPDLFWAMRGGGGGTFAVLTKYRVQLHPVLPIHTYTLKANFSAESNGLRSILTAHAENQLAWSQELVTGSVDYLVDYVEFGAVLPFADDGSKLAALIAPFVEAVSKSAEITILTNNFTSYASYLDYTGFSAADAKATEAPGISQLLASRLMPRSLFAATASIAALVDAILYGITTARALSPASDITATQVVFETPVSNPDPERKTSVNPAWRTALWHVIHVGEWTAPLEAAEQKNVTLGFLDLLTPLKALSPGGGAYLNEASYEEPEWEETFWGDNYGKLVGVKDRYDPEHLFDCWKCVGWRGEDE